ncbi:MAG: sigma 54-interacting transcriptional regulator [Oscillospiraceae bacterium]|nr:sigma 54-interacting transcriptional regulator [Oscillospiraceae bacterium]
MIDSYSLIKMLEFSYDGIWITDGDGKILFANAANATLLGVNQSELIGQTTQQLLDDRVFSDSAILEAIKKKQQISKVCYNYNTKLTVLATATPILDEDGNVKHVFNNVRDITKLSQLQGSLREKDEIILQQNRQLESMKIRMGMGTIVANSKAFGAVVELAQRVAAFDGATVLILGESGTGKELIAELIVNHSARKNKPYRQVNCGAIPENLIESELFGYEKGAFTGADSKGRKGLFEAANGGTVFLDEIGDLPLHMQVKLLRVLQQKKVTRVGGAEEIALNVRVIAATNKNLEEMVRNNQFREDLYYRLNVVSISIPPLRERKEDIVPLINHFLTVINQKYGTQKSIFSDTVDRFESYDWPGNVRELENLLENLVITTPGNIICRENLPKKLISGAERLAPSDAQNHAVVPLRTTVEQAERGAIEEAIRRCGSIRKAASALHVDPSTIVRKMQGYKQENLSIET